MVSHAGGGTAGVQLVGNLVGAVIESIVIHALVDAHAPQDDAGVIAVLQDHLYYNKHGTGYGSQPYSIPTRT